MIWVILACYPVGWILLFVFSRVGKTAEEIDYFDRSDFQEFCTGLNRQDSDGRLLSGIVILIAPIMVAVFTIYSAVYLAGCTLTRHNPFKGRKRP